MAAPDLDELAWLRRARDHLGRFYAEPITVGDVARAACMSPAHFTRRFKAVYGETPHAHLMTRRIERAAALLRGGEMSVTEVCLAVGCTSLGSFSSSFQRIMGESPTSYRNRDHSPLEQLPPCLARSAGRPGYVGPRLAAGLNTGLNTGRNTGR